MTTERLIFVCGLNVVTHPHGPEGYVALMKALFSMRQAKRVRSTQHLLMGELYPLDSQTPLKGFFGRLYRFDQIEPDAPWFNVARNEPATDDEMAAVAIPEHLKPNLVMFDFVFYPRGHCLYFVVKAGRDALSPRSVQSMLLALCADPKIAERFGKVEITILPDKETLDRILGLPRLAKLTIDLVRPNPDDTSADEQRVLRRLAKQNTRRLEQVLTAEPHETIEPDDETRLLANVAAKNGKVTAIGYSADGVRIDESTVDKPWRAPVAYDSGIQTGADALVSFTSQLPHGKS